MLKEKKKKKENKREAEALDEKELETEIENKRGPHLVTFAPRTLAPCQGQLEPFLHGLLEPPPAN